MRLMTYNIWDGGGARAPLIAAVIKAADPDVVLLNEADDEQVVAELARGSGCEYVWARGSGSRHIALLSRLPIAAWRVFNRRPLTQAVLSVRLDPGPAGGAVQLFGVHLVPYFMLLPYEFARWRTLRALLKMVRAQVPGPHLLLGDFNAVSAGERADTHFFSKTMQSRLRLQANIQPRFALRQIPRAGYTDCFRSMNPGEPGLTHMPWAPSARLDYIFADEQMAARLRACYLVTAEPAARASDHFPLVAEFA